MIEIKARAAGRGNGLPLAIFFRREDFGQSLGAGWK
jgi:hypothetical protein